MPVSRGTDELKKGFLGGATSTRISRKRNSDLGKMLRLQIQETTRKAHEHRLELNHQQEITMPAMVFLLFSCQMHY